MMIKLINYTTLQYGWLPLLSDSLPPFPLILVQVETLCKQVEGLLSQKGPSAMEKSETRPQAWQSRWSCVKLMQSPTVQLIDPVKSGGVLSRDTLQPLTINPNFSWIVPVCAKQALRTPCEKTWICSDPNGICRLKSFSSRLSLLDTILGGTPN